MNEDDFNRITGSQFGQMEAAVGTDAYQANVAHTKAATESVKVYAEMKQMQTKLLGAAAGIVPVLIIMAIPLWLALCVHVWKAVL